MSRFDDRLASLVEGGALSEDEAAELRDASPLKAERDQAKADADAARARAAELENKQASGIFTKLGIPGGPDTYKLPDDVDRTDEAQIAAWATQVGLLKPSEPAAPSPDQQAHQRMDAVTAGGAPPPPANVSSEIGRLQKEILRAGRDQIQPGSELYGRVLDAIQSAGHTFGEVPHGTNFERIPDWGSKTPA